MKVKKSENPKKSGKKQGKQKKKKSLAEVTTDDFFNQDFENLDVSDDEEDEVQEKTKKVPENSKKTGKKTQNKNIKNSNDKLLDFNEDDDELDSMLSEDDDDLKYIPDDELELGSDESDFEPDVPEKDIGNKIKVTFKLLKSWQEEIKNEKSAKTIRCLVDAFHAAVEAIAGVEVKSTQYVVEGGAIVNGISQNCIMLLPQAFKKFLHITDEAHFEAHKAKRFPKIKNVLKSYLSDLITVLQSVSSPDTIQTLLKHLNQMIPFTHSFSSLRKPLLRILLKFWSTTDENTADVPILAFMCIAKIATKNAVILNGLLKTMYIKYVQNSKFVSPNTLSGINFMRQSLSELYLVNNEYGYNNAFLYLRQLAIHLRNALTMKKKEHFQAVYNWQYINSLWFWAELIPKAEKQSHLRSLIYPLVQITIGVANLIPTSQYYPLRFHCVKMLINISRETGVFIPSLPLLLGVLEDYDFNKKHKIVSMKPMSLMCLLRVSKSQASENGYKDALIEKIYELLLESAAKDSHYVYFPDMYVIFVVKMKEFLNKCKVLKYTQKLKQLLNKVEETRQFIDTERSKKVFDLKNLKETEIWEEKIKESGTPVSKFYDSWVKVHKFQQMKLQAQSNKEDIKVPHLKKSKRKADYDSDENSDLEIPVEEMEKILKKQKKNDIKVSHLKKSKRKADHVSDENSDLERPVEEKEKILKKEKKDIVKNMNLEDW